jgi:hypothetical protein
MGYLGHVLMENRNGLLVQVFLTEGAERDAAMLMAETIPGGERDLPLPVAQMLWALEP